MSLFVDDLETPWGLLQMQTDESHLLRVCPVAQLGVSVPNELTRLCKAQLQEYISGKRCAFDLPYRAEGTAFQREIWAQLARIPYGETCSYQELARAIARPKACRAVGSACGANPLLLIIPCHRVIAANGQIGNYLAGPEMKTALLKMEASSATSMSGAHASQPCP